MLCAECWAGNRSSTPVRQRRNSAPGYGAYVFEDENGQFTLEHGRNGWFGDYYKKAYIGGEYQGSVVEATKEEWGFYKEEGKALYGYEDWLGDFQPGLLVPNLPVVPETLPVNMDMEQNQWTSGTQVNKRS